MTFVQVSTKGILSFGQPITSAPQPLSDVSGPIIAPFWSDVDTRGRGTVYYRISNDQMLLDRVAANIQATFPDSFSGFYPTSVLVVTWDDVGYYSNGSDLVSSWSNDLVYRRVYCRGFSKIRERMRGFILI